MDASRAVLQNGIAVAGGFLVVNILVHSMIFRSTFFNHCGLVQYLFHQILVGAIGGIVRIHLNRDFKRLLCFSYVAERDMSFKESFVNLGERGLESDAGLAIFERPLEVFEGYETSSSV